mmetsp:Transcript_20122/g.68432  ORF Transcript_20122/g.68432 Transcript_20122/m.68432 type:complete len:1613 (-) Transcript_20122:1629-6467(-)|eukprot:CAMPEP_0183806126 /NCGR_PEP_ID=MMETSP0803_2-20130417/38774_1 /TAXON_ID=195967 /ORGANISM="Crustomastix stigmata, Strain CCMP3273" /LENGTH=1612 /DNA_ID=CAMNT_0026050887 /DNA_START=221 /DNA_END=5059 /DNA_ORIENTATION=-
MSAEGDWGHLGDAAADEDEEDYEVSPEDDQEDDEETLEQEIRDAELRGEDDHEEEMAALRAEAELPIEEILRRAGYHQAPLDRYGAVGDDPGRAEVEGLKECEGIGAEGGEVEQEKECVIVEGAKEDLQDEQKNSSQDQGRGRAGGCGVLARTGQSVSSSGLLPTELSTPVCPSVSDGVEAVASGSMHVPGQSQPVVSAQAPLLANVAVEEAILERADEIRARGPLTKPVPKYPEPPRNKTHWDYLLEEMAWLAKDVKRERDWKLKQCRKFAGHVQRSRLDVESRAIRREREQYMAIRKVASTCAREVMLFWGKVERLVLYKQQSAIDSRRQQAMDKHLNFLVGQTERYSNLLAKDLQRAPKDAAPPLSAEAQSGAEGDDDDYVADEGEALDDDETLEAELREAELRGEDEYEEEMAALRAEADIPIEQLMQQYSVQAGHEERAPGGGARTSPETPPPQQSRLAQLLSAGGDDGAEEDYIAGASEEEEDDEETLEQELREAEMLGDDNHDEEMAALRADAELPIEEIHRHYALLLAQNEDLSTDYKEGGPLQERSHDNSEEGDMGEVKSEDEDDEDADERDDAVGLDQLLDTEDFKAARASQPTGNTLCTSNTDVKVPFLLKHSLREYQHVGMSWLVSIYEKQLNGILADEMGLGKTIQTIALLAHLACEKGIWGPHLIVVPTSVMLNWEMEFKKWCPAFKILTYYGSAKERKLKRVGWSKPNSFHVCITTYTLITQDAKVFRRKKWKYLILDEAHLIKNWRSQRWQTLLNFNSKRRVLITGTPLQNDLMELWALMHFLMPHVFQSHDEFKNWFSQPLTGMVEGNSQINLHMVQRLHGVLRPFLLRRLKSEVEKGLPPKYEHVVHCRMSRRQRRLYEEYMASSDTVATLSSGNLLGVINCLMQLRKVCNHPDLFAGRAIVSAFDMPPLQMRVPSLVLHLQLEADCFSSAKMRAAGLLITENDTALASWEADECRALSVTEEAMVASRLTSRKRMRGTFTCQEAQEAVNIFADAREATNRVWRIACAEALARQSIQRASARPLYGRDTRAAVWVRSPADGVHFFARDARRVLQYTNALRDAVVLPCTRLQRMREVYDAYCFAIPKARTTVQTVWCSRPLLSNAREAAVTQEFAFREVGPLLTPLRSLMVRRQLFFPDRRLLQFDCGKLQQLAELLRRLRSEGHRALIFTQMSKMLDILEAFLNLYGYTYLRLDGTTKTDQRQILTQRFNTDTRVFCFILSTRSGGVGINLTGADTVIFYDSDWNPAMDQQAQDRAHRIGQTREVHVYRMVTEATVEENILRKATQKRQLDYLAIQSGGFNTKQLADAQSVHEPKQIDPREFFDGMPGVPRALSVHGAAGAEEVCHALRESEDDADARAREQEEEAEAADAAELNADVKVSENPDAEDEEIPAAVPGQPGPTAIPQAVQEEGEDGMLNDIVLKTTAAAAAAGGSLEDALRPVERYALRWLEEVEPVVDRSAVEVQVTYEEREWELEKLQREKAAAEAAASDSEDQLVVESWDTKEADHAYERARQQAADLERIKADAEERRRIALEVEAERNARQHLGTARPIKLRLKLAPTGDPAPVHADLPKPKSEPDISGEPPTKRQRMVS